MECGLSQRAKQDPDRLDIAVEWRTAAEASQAWLDPQIQHRPAMKRLRGESVALGDAPAATWRRKLAGRRGRQAESISIIRMVPTARCVRLTSPSHPLTRPWVLIARPERPASNPRLTETARTIFAGKTPRFAQSRKPPQLFAGGLSPSCTVRRENGDRPLPLTPANNLIHSDNLQYHGQPNMTKNAISFHRIPSTFIFPPSQMAIRCSSFARSTQCPFNLRMDVILALRNVRVQGFAGILRTIPRCSGCRLRKPQALEFSLQASFTRSALSHAKA